MRNAGAPDYAGQARERRAPYLGRMSHHEIRVLLEGKTAAGAHLLVTEKYSTPGYDDRFAITLDGEQVEVGYVERFRDGGTTQIETPLGLIYVPAPHKSELEPTFAGEPVTRA